MAVLRWILAAGIIVILPGELNCQLTCIPESGCKFKLSNGETFDFCPSFEHGAATTAIDDNIYTYNGGSPVPCDPSYTGQALCLGFAGSEIVIGLGLTTNLACSVVSLGDSPTLTMDYRGGENERISRVTVYFEKGRTEVDFSYISDDGNTYYFDYHIPHDGGPSEQGGVDPGIPGIILLVLLLVAVVGYIVVGMLVMRFYRGAQGLEMIPNFSFWKDFPYLLKDGVVFTFTAWPCCKSIGYNRVR